MSDAATQHRERAARFAAVIDGVTGTFFDAPQPDSIVGALDRFEAQRFDAAVIKEHAGQFTEQRYAQRLYAAVDELAESAHRMPD